MADTTNDEFKQAQLELDNCVDIATLSETYSLHQLRKNVYRFMCGHLMEFSQAPNFQQLSASQLEYILSCDHPVDCPESDVLQIVLQWLEFSSDRLPYAVPLLSRIHYHVSRLPVLCRFGYVQQLKRLFF